MPPVKNILCQLLLLTCVLTTKLKASSPPVKYIGIEQGLSNNAVTSIYQDKNGFLWFGTYDGLNKYNGYSIQVFRNRIGDSSTLTNNSVYVVNGDHLNRIWVGGEKGLCVYQPLSGKFIPLYHYKDKNTNPTQVADVIHCITPIEDQRMLAGTSHHGLLDYATDLQAVNTIPLESANGNRKYTVSAIEFDQHTGLVWVFVQQEGLFRYDPARKMLFLVNGSIKQAKSLKTGTDGNLWLGNNDGLFKFYPRVNRYSGNSLSGNNSVAHLNLDKEGVLWIGTDGAGLWTIPSDSLIARPYLTSNGQSPLNSNSIFAVYEDRQSRKWIGTLRGGINMIDSRNYPFRLLLHNKSDEQNPVQNFILALCEDKDQNIWIGTDGAGLRYWNRKTNESTEFAYRRGQAAGISSNFITNIEEDTDGDIWISTWFGGINRIDKSTGTIRHYQCYNPISRSNDPHAWIVYEDTKKQIWASTTNEGSLYTFNRDENRFQLFDAAISNLQCLYEDAEGNLWGGNYSELIRIDRRFKQHQRFDVGTTVRAIYQDKQKDFWLGTQGGGLLRINKLSGQFKRFTEEDGLPSNTILRILEDEQGILWLTTFNGLSKFNPRDSSFQNFTQSDGLQSNQFSFNAGIRLQNGEMIVGGIKGLTLFHPDSVRFGTIHPPLFLNGLTVSNKSPEESRAYITAQEIDKVKELTVPFELATIRFDFLGLDYSFPDKIQYAYKLEGWEKEWNQSKEQRTATYMRLQEGSYTFKVKATGSDGQWGEAASLVTLVVLPPWYRTSWAYLIYMLLVVGLIIGYSVYAARQARLIYEVKLANLENQKEKELHERKLGVYTQVSHEFRTPLTLIINPVKELLNNKQLAASHKELNVVYRNARRLLSLVDQLLHFRKADSGADQLFRSDCLIHDVCTDIFQCFVQEAKLKSISYQFIDRLENNPPLLSVDKEKIEIALFNLLSNAFKFTPQGGSITMELNAQGDYLEIIVRDTGCGIEPDEIEKIFNNFQQAGQKSRHRTSGFGIGLFLVHHFITMHGGKVDCQSEPGIGSLFAIRLPVQMNHAPLKSSGLPEVTSGHLKEWMTESPDMEPSDEPKPNLVLTDPLEKIITHRKLILIIDDNPEILAYLKTSLSKKYLVITAANGQDGYELATQRLPDLILSDINMEGLNGLDLCKQLKTNSTTSHIPLLLLTAEADSEMEILGIQGGADDYITKPFELDVLFARMDVQLRNRSALHQFFFDEVTLKGNAVKVPAEYQQFLGKCIEVIDRNIDNEEFTMKSFAQQMGMSQSGLYQKIKTISGQSLNSFIRTIRLRKAAVLMLTENMNISQAAFQVGFADSRYFREQFARLFGMNPSEYIKKYRDTFNQDCTIVRSTES